MNIKLTQRQFRRLLDLVYVGNWILNSNRGEERFAEYDDVENAIFSLCNEAGLPGLGNPSGDHPLPSRAFMEGGIHEAIMDYEDTVFFEILAEELAKRDIIAEGGSEEDSERLTQRMSAYIAEFERNGTDNISIEL